MHIDPGSTSHTERRIPDSGYLNEGQMPHKVLGMKEKKNNLKVTSNHIITYLKCIVSYFYVTYSS